MTRLEKIKKIIRLDETGEYVTQARESADAIEGIMSSTQSQDEKTVAVWEYFKSLGICSETELTNVS